MLDLRQRGFKRLRHPFEIEGLDEESRVPRLAAAAAAHEAAKLLFDRSAAPLDLLLKRAERREVAVLFDHLQDAFGPQGADQLRLQVRLADVENGRQAGALEGTPELRLLGRVAEAGYPGPAKALEVTADRLRAAHCDDLDCVRSETASLGQRLEGDLVAGTFDEDYVSLHDTLT
jgi:hypothetical protein